MLKITAPLTLFMLSFSSHASDLNTQGLAFWFSADHGAEATLWANQVDESNSAKLVEGFKAPVCIPSAINGKPALRFTGEEAFTADFPEADGETGGITSFIVASRPEKTSEVMWQRIISSLAPNCDHDSKSPSWFSDIGKSAELMEPTIRTRYFSTAARQPFVIGHYHGDNDKERLAADIAEIIIYDYRMTDYKEVEAVLNYLREKYNIEEKTDQNWVRAGLLPPTPQQRTHKLPLSDQHNTKNWKPFRALWDEFEGDTLDESKWWDHNPGWRGRLPARFMPRNVEVSEGKLHLTFRHEPNLPKHPSDTKNEFYDYTGASVCSKTSTRYGYYEIKAKAMASSASSAWWFSGTSTNALGQSARNELDVFELGGKAKDHETQYGMNLHVFQSPETGKDHLSFNENWEAPFRFIDDYHVYGVEWDPEFIRYYVDGHLVRTQINTYWTTPLIMIFDSEAMFDWLGTPPNDDLPSTFSVVYVRAWTNSNLPSPFTYAKDPAVATELTEDLRAFEASLPQLR